MLYYKYIYLLAYLQGVFNIVNEVTDKNSQWL